MIATRFSLGEEFGFFLIIFGPIQAGSFEGSYGDGIAGFLALACGSARLIVNPADDTGKGQYFFQNFDGGSEVPSADFRSHRPKIYVNGTSRRTSGEFFLNTAIF